MLCFEPIFKQTDCQSLRLPVRMTLMGYAAGVRLRVRLPQDALKCTNKNKRNKSQKEYFLL